MIDFFIAMHCFDNVFVIVGVIVGFVLINCKSDHLKDESESDKDEDITPEDLYSFIALIDLVFTDGTKKTCTGTIIHDNVVITVAHCFETYDDNIIKAELTASFVVIGTKKMFDTGYEQYLPIERVIIHPNYSGWKADLALVYTFAGMMSDKPGLIVPLASDKTITPVDSDLTVFSWGQFNINSHMAFKHPSKTEDDSSDDNKYEGSDVGTDRNVNENVTSYILSNLESHTDEDIEKSSPTSLKIETTEPSPMPFRQRQRRRIKKKKNRKIIRQRRQSIENQEEYHLRQASTEIRSKPRTRPLQIGNIAVFDSEAKILNWDKKKDNPERFYMKVPTSKGYRTFRQSLRATSYYRTKWRRKMGDQKKKLAVEIFGLVNMQMCKKTIQKGMSSSYELKNPNEVLCYASEAHFVTEEDSGAPAMRRGRLVAVTVGGVNFEGERVAVGLKMTCFCSWISDNIPISGTKWKCCKNCCEAKVDTEQNHLHSSHAHHIKTRSKKVKIKF